ncbi:hypothetical protein R5R35_007243 [Gryllus longicercus]|uniref:Uncharacterized protein n=1 Tax=Gryllus longicercus TaxID=2509291 RepID=A0AAN9YYH1_9ORTH
MALTALPNNPMNFTENQHGNAILEKLKQQKEQFCDVTLYIDGKKYKAHRNVLASCSPYFDSVLKMHKTVKEGLTITCQNPEVFHCLLNYMYTGSIVIDKNNVAELLRLANHFLVAKLRNYCAEYLDRYLDITNCLSVREMAEKYNMPSLMKAATLFIQVNVTKVIFQEEILYCPLRKIEAFLSEKSWSVPHSMLLGLIARWVMQDVNVRERSMRALLTFVDWHAVDGNAITEHIDREPLYSTSELSLYFVLQSLMENNLLFTKYQGVFQALQEKLNQNGMLLENDSFLNVAVSSAIEGLQDVTDDSNALQTPSDKSKQQMSDNMDKCCSMSDNSMTVKSKLVLTRCRRYKQKVIGVRPGARLAALKAALAARRKKLVKIPNNSVHNDIQGRHSCHLCSHMAHSLCLLEEHLALAHSKDVTYKCGMCGFICQWNKDYLSHMKEHFEGPPFKCDSCKFTCDHINALLAHRLKHSGDQPYHCDECGYQCSSRSDLMIHKQCHLNGRHSYKCDTCGKHFTFKSSLEQHLLTHGNDRPYLCDTCGFSTKHLSLLIAHKRIHSGAWLLRMKFCPNILQFTKDSECWDAE